MLNRKRFIASLKKRSSLRLHMTLILLATSMAGVLASKLLLTLGLHNVALRYPITVLFAYLVFFVAIKIWLGLMTDAPSRASNLTASNLLDNLDIPLPLGKGTEAAFAGGGSFGGGGASGDFGASLGEVGSEAGNALGGVGDAVGEVVGGIGDDEGGLALVIVLALLAVLLFSLLGVGLFLVWQGPAILAEAAFNSVLAASLVRSTKRMKEPDWVGSVVQATWKPFALVFTLALLAGSAMHHYLPQASRVLDVIHLVW
ncbi:MAG: hypothetical protein HGA96_03640 [Desulfobulbaceae bacterium]|nr:hypothetical protein [Desulfobulbaceae bacterium]